MNVQIKEKKRIVFYVKCEVLMAVKMSMLVFWVVTPCELAGRYQHFRKEDGDSMFL
jgi:hypothetical protein